MNEFPSTWSRHRAKKCLSDCFYCLEKGATFIQRMLNGASSPKIRYIKETGFSNRHSKRAERAITFANRHASKVDNSSR